MSESTIGSSTGKPGRPPRTTKMTKTTRMRRARQLMLSRSIRHSSSCDTCKRVSFNGDTVTCMRLSATCISHQQYNNSISPPVTIEKDYSTDYKALLLRDFVMSNIRVSSVMSMPLQILERQVTWVSAWIGLIRHCHFHRGDVIDVIWGYCAMQGRRW